MPPAASTDMAGASHAADASSTPPSSPSRDSSESSLAAPRAPPSAASPSTVPAVRKGCSVCGGLLGGPGRHEAIEIGGVQFHALGAVEQLIDLPELYRREVLATCRQSFHQRLCQALISGRGGQRSASEQQLTLHDGPRNSILQYQAPAFARLRQIPQTHLGIHEVAGPTRNTFARSATLLRAAFLTTPSTLA